MIRKVKSLIHLSRRKKFLLLISVPIAIWSQILFALFTNRPLLRREWMHRSTKRKPIISEEVSLIWEIKSVIQILKLNLPWKTYCRHDAYIAIRLMDFYRISYCLYIGAKKDIKNEVKGHVWVMHGQIFITGQCNLQKYTILHTVVRTNLFEKTGIPFSK